MANRPRRSRKRGPKAAHKQQSLAASASHPTQALAPEPEATSASEPVAEVVREAAPEPAPAVVVEPTSPERLEPVVELSRPPASRPVEVEVSVPIPLAVERPALRAAADPEVPGWRTWPARLGAMLREAAAFGSASTGRLIARSSRGRSQGAQSRALGSTTVAYADVGGASAGRAPDVHAGEAVYARVVASVERHATALAGQRRRGIVRNDFGRAIDTRAWLDSRAAYVDRYLALSDAEYRALGAYFRTVERAGVHDKEQVRTRLTGLVLERELERCLSNRVYAAEALVQSHAAGVDAAD